MKRPLLTKHRAAILAGTFALIAASCGSGDESTTSDPVATVAATSPATPTSEAPPGSEPEASPVPDSNCPPAASNSESQPSGVVVDLPDDDSGYTEGVVVDRSGNVFVSLIRTGTVLELAPGSDEPEVFGQIPDWSDDGVGFLGLAADEVGNIYGAAASDTTAGIWKFDCVSGVATRIAGTEEMVFANGVVVDQTGIIYATDADSGADGDTGLGAIWRIDTDGPATKWLESAALGSADPDSELPGANGLAVDDDVIYVANTAQSLVLAIPILPDGSPGDPTTIVDVVAPDGVTLDADGRLYVTSALNEIVRVDLDGTVARLAAGPDAPLACPTSLVVGAGTTAGTMYVTNLDGGCDGAGPDLVAFDIKTAPFVTDAADGPPEALFVVGDAANPDPLDQFLVDIAGSNDIAVTLLDDDETNTADGQSALQASDLVMISGSVDPSTVSADLAALAVPLINLAGELSVDLGMATESGETPSGETWIAMNPDTADHPLAAQLEGQQDAYSAPVDALNFGVVGDQAIVIATAPGAPPLTAHYAYEAGTVMADGTTAPARRHASYAPLESLSSVSGISAVLFFAGIDWLLGRT